jgi:hypothetical protein
MTRSSTAQAERTVAELQRGLAAGVPVSIPGAWERRVDVTDTVDGETADPAPRMPEAPAGLGRERLEREREGGGAPSTRPNRRVSILARLWRGVRGSAT